jgi:alpha-glucosidase
MKSGCTALLVFLCAAHPLFAQWRSAPAVDSLSRSGPAGVTFRAGEAAMTVTVLADDLMRIRFTHGTGLPPDRSRAVVAAAWPTVQAVMNNAPDAFTITTSALTLRVAKNPLRLSFRDPAGAIISEDAPAKGMGWSGSEVRVWKTMPGDERYYGFGEKAGSFERGNLHMTMWNSDIPAYSAQTDPLYQTIPFFYGMRNGRAYGIFLDNTYRTSFDMGKEARDQYSFGAEDGVLDYYFFYGPAPRTILGRFTQLVGRMPLPPRWSLGYQQCRWSYTPDSRVREIASGFRSRRIPCDVIYLDIDYMDGYRIFTWHPKSFPDPEGLLRELKGMGFTTAVIVDPGIKVDTAYAAYRSGLAGGHFLRYPDGSLFTGKVWPGVCAFPDFTAPAARRWWGDQFAGLAAAGVRGWWNDMNEPSVFDVPGKTVDLGVLHDDEGLKTTHAKNHNIYGMEMTRATYEGARRLLPAERPFVLTRASYAGGWRYSAAWTGDNVSSWEHLSMALAMCLNLGISGQPFVGADIGGFIGHPSGELFARWLQLGVLTPLMRSHSVINEKNKEPWEYGSAFTDINRETINLRYRLLPYIYTVMSASSLSGLPAMRPMVFEHPGDARFTSTAGQFMFGDDMLAAPVLAEGETTKTVELPHGRWHDFWTGRAMNGGATYTVPAPIGHLPLFVPAGATIPMQQIVQHTGEAPINPLTLRTFPSHDGKAYISHYYEDDGSSFAYVDGVSFRRTFTARSVPGQVVLSLSGVEGSYVPPGRGVAVQFVDFGADPPSRVTLNGMRVAKAARGSGSIDGSGWEFDAPARTVIVRVPDSRGPMELVLSR